MRDLAVIAVLLCIALGGASSVEAQWGSISKPSSVRVPRLGDISAKSSIATNWSLDRSVVASKRLVELREIDYLAASKLSTARALGATKLRLARLRLTLQPTSRGLTSALDEVIADLSQADLGGPGCALDDRINQAFQARRVRKSLQKAASRKPEPSEKDRLGIPPDRDWNLCDHAFFALKQRFAATDLGVAVSRGQVADSCAMLVEGRALLGTDALFSAFAEAHAAACGAERGSTPLESVVAAALALTDSSADERLAGSKRHDLEEQCEAGNGAACNNLGVVYEVGRFVGVNLGRTRELFIRACDSGDQIGCSNVAMLYRLGRGVPADPEEAARLYQSVIDADTSARTEVWASLGLGSMWAGGEVPGTPRERGFAVLQAICERNKKPIGCNDWAVALEEGEQVDEAALLQALALFERACEGGIPLACLNLSFFYQEGKAGLEVDRDRAAKLQTRACESGLMNACAYRAAYEIELSDAPETPPLAAALSLHACNAGDGLGCGQVDEWLGGQATEASRAALKTAACLGGDEDSCDDS